MKKVNKKSKIRRIDIIKKLPNKKYNIIYADPPWDFRDMKGTSFGIGKQYPTLKDKELAALPIKNITTKDCILFMWTTHAHIESAIKIAKCWGFKYITIGFEWFKSLKMDKPVCMIGHWTTGGAIELCLLFKKGHPKRICKTVPRLVFQRRTEHSHKPEEVRKRIIQLMGDLPRIELFAREHIQGWDVWGNEAPDEITGFVYKKHMNRPTLL